MEQKNFLTPAEVAAFCCQTGIAKANTPKVKQFILGILAGVYIAFAAAGSNMAAHGLLADPATYGMGRLAAGLVFSAGLGFVLVAGSELFTGNTLIAVAVLEKKVSVGYMLTNWVIVYIGNLVGSVLIAYLVTSTSLLDSSGSLLGAMTIKIAVGKVGLGFLPAFYLGILCNWLVCIAVWMSFAAKDIISKLFCCFFPISLFVTSGYEHSVANMAYIPLGILAKANEKWTEAAINLGVTAEQMDGLTWSSMFTKNLLPVTLGNIVGGTFCVGVVYWYCYLRKKTAK